jgi:hypothetical protein
MLGLMSTVTLVTVPSGASVLPQEQQSAAMGTSIKSAKAMDIILFVILNVSFQKYFNTLYLIIANDILQLSK